MRIISDIDLIVIRIEIYTVEGKRDKYDPPQISRSQFIMIAEPGNDPPDDNKNRDDSKHCMTLIRAIVIPDHIISEDIQSRNDQRKKTHDHP